jgi:hypothetical protein
MKDAAALIFHGPDTALSKLPDRKFKIKCSSAFLLNQNIPLLI